MPWRVNTLTEYKATDGLHAEVAAPSSEGTKPGDDAKEPGEDAGSVELFSYEGEPAFDSGHFDDNFLEFEGQCESLAGSHDFDTPLADRVKVSLDLGASQVPRGPVMSEAGFDQFLTHAFLRTRGPLAVKMPWERGVFGKIFNKSATDLQPVFQQPRVWVCQNLDLVEDKKDDIQDNAAGGSELVGAFFERALTAVSDMSFQQQRSNLLETAVEKWHCIIRVNMLASSTGRDIISFGSLEEQKRGAFETIEAVIGVRSRTTAITRANAFLKFLRWRADEGNDGKSFSEHEAWQYLRELREKGAAPTKGASFLSACAYAWHVFGFNDLEGICTSRRLKGLCDLMYAVKAPLRQALVLTVRQVLMLHELLESLECNVVDRAVAAYLLIALYGRCRHSDLQNLEDAFVDVGPEGGYLELTTRTHKTSRTAAQKSRLLPLVLPAVGVQGREWVTMAKLALENYGLKLEGHIGGPLFRPPGSNGNSYCKRGLTSHEVSRFLRVMLGEQVAPSNEGGVRLSSHSLKATVLSWASKAGMDVQDKSILGRHTSAYSESSAVYARDLSIGAVSRLQHVILQIYKGEFMPDAPRSGYYPVAERLDVEPCNSGQEVVKVEDEMSEQEPAQSEVRQEGEPQEDECSASSDGSESLEGSDSEEEIQEPGPKAYRHCMTGQLAEKFVMHKVSHLVHYADQSMAGGAGLRLISCGRALNQNYKPIGNFDSVDMCRRCRTNAVKDGVLPKPAV